MKRVVLLGIMFFVPILLMATTYTTITIDTINSGWQSDEIFNDCSNADNAYFTWDENYLYFGISDAEADYDKMATFMYFNIDPDGSNGTTDAYAWGNNIKAPFQVDYVVVWENKFGQDYIEVIEWNSDSSTWNQKASNNASWLNPDGGNDEVFFVIGKNYREVRVSRSYLGISNSSDKVDFCSFTEQQWEEGTYYRYFVFPKNDGIPGDIGNRAESQSIQHYRGYVLGEGYSPNSSGSYDQSLPVTLTSFSAKAVKGNVVLEWETSAEIENQGFVISRQCRDRFQTRPEIIASFATDEALKGQGSTTESTQYRYVDTGVELGKTYIYTLADVDYEGKETILEKVEVQVGAEGAVVADNYALDPLYPNPFNATLTIPFTLTESMNVSIDLYSITGQKMMTVINCEFGTGSYNYTVQTHDLASGMYVVRTSFNGRNHMQKAVLLK